MIRKVLRGVSRRLPSVRNAIASYRDARRYLEADRNGLLIVTDYSYPEKPHDWTGAAGATIIKQNFMQNVEEFEQTVQAFEQFSDQFKRIPVEGDPNGDDPYWSNGWLPGPDAASIYSLLAINNPAIYFEIGSGNSTKFARRAIRDHNLKTRIISVDPEPRANIDKLCDEVIRKRCEDCPPSLYSTWDSSTIMFVDNSHRSFRNSDVTFFFLEILPRIGEGVTWALHDIFLPYDYPEHWRRYYNEQYLLLAYLLGGGGLDKVILPIAFLTSEDCNTNIFARTIFENEFFKDVEKGGCCFWLNRQTASLSKSPHNSLQ